MRYYIFMEEDEQNEDYGRPLALFRYESTPDILVTEWWNPDTEEWEHEPEVIGVTGIGGADDFHVVDDGEVERVKIEIKNSWEGD